MNSNTLALLNARTGLVQFKHALVLDLILIGFSLYAYFFISASGYHLLFTACVLLLVLTH